LFEAYECLEKLWYGPDLITEGHAYVSKKLRWASRVHELKRLGVIDSNGNPT
jgi:hypothetical protein